MGLLHTSFTSGNMFTAGSDYGDIGTSGLNEITNRINVGSGVLGTISGAYNTTSGAGVTDIANLTAVSGAYVATSGALYTVSGALTTDITNLTTVSGAYVATSGALYTVSGAGYSNTTNLNTVSGAGVVVSGATVTNKGTLNFGLFDIPQTQDMTYTTNATGNLTAAIISGPSQHYEVIGSYNADESPIEIIFSGTSIGSTIKQVFWYQTNGSLVTSTGSLISGTMAVY